MRIISWVILLAVIAVQLTAAADEQPSPLKGNIDGIITDQITGEPIAGATVYLVDRFGGAIAKDDGRFVLSNLKPDIYAVRVSHLGYEATNIDSIVVVAGESVTVEIELIEKVHNLKGITVTPGHFSIMGTEAAASQSLTRRELETTPQFGEDLYRAVKRLPGIAAEDFSSRFYVRGGEHDQVLVTLDGLQLYEPFHLKDFKGGFFSAIDASAIESVDLMTGGYTADYGDRASGVLKITSHRPPTDERKVSAAISFMNARFMTEGTFDKNRGSWLLSARRGYIDILMKIAGEGDKLRPTYYDLLSKVQYQLSDKHILSGHFFYAGDRFKVIENDNNDADTIISSFDNTYLWMKLQSQLRPRLTAHSVVSMGRVTHDRYGFSFWNYEQLKDAQISDVESFTVLGLKSDLEYEVSDNYLLKTGFDVRSLSADYSYFGTDNRYYRLEDGTIELAWIDTVSNSRSPSGDQIGAYVSNRLRVAPPFTVEVGGRFDHHSYTDDESFSPRVNFAYQVGEYTTIRGGWGYYYQAQRIDELFSGDGLNEFYSAERAEHRTIGLDHDFGTGMRLRLEAYHKKYTDLRPETRNTFNEFHAFPEFESDRVIVYRDYTIAEGFEVYLKREKGSKFTWWASYCYGKVEDKINRISYTPGTTADDEPVVYDAVFPNPHDQRHTIYVDLSYRPTLRWQFNLAWHYHSGWPYTGVELRTAEIEGETVVWINQAETLGERYPDYSRLDVRLNRYLDLWGGRLTVFFEIINLTGRENVQGYIYNLVGTGSDMYIEREVEATFPTLPVLGVTYSLNM